MDMLHIGILVIVFFTMVSLAFMMCLDFIYDFRSKTETKYKLTGEKIVECGHILYRIKACRSFGDVKAGDLGGFIESESCVSHYGNCWIYDNARVFGGALVHGSAQIREDARIFGMAQVCGCAHVFGNAQVSEKAWVLGRAQLCGNAHVRDTWVSGNVKLDSGIWYTRIQINGRLYLLSTTLKKCLVEYDNE